MNTRLMGVWNRLWRRFLKHPAPSALVAIYLSLRWRSQVALSADIRYPFRLRMGRGCRLGSCRIICSGQVVLGDSVLIDDGAILNTYGATISIGDRTTIRPYAVLYGGGGLSIGRDCAVAAHSIIVPSNHGIADLETPMMRQPLTRLGITISDNVWIAARCVILDGVTIGEGAVVAAGAVVTRNVGREDIVAGVPARRIRNRRQAAAGVIDREAA